MTKKCDKYESLFIFADEETLNTHLQECEDCRREHEKMHKVSALVKEAEPELKRRAAFFNSLKVACVLFLFITGGVFFQTFAPMQLNNTNATMTASISSDMSFDYEDSIIADMGLPTDDYGLLMLD